MPADEIQTTDNVRLVLCDANGNVKLDETTHNLIVTVGKNGIADQLIAAPTISKPSHIGVGTGATAPAAGDTALQTELDRNALTSKTRATNVVTMVGDWAAGDATGALTEAGIFDAATTGNLYARATFSVVNKASTDTLQITWTFTVG